MNFVEGIEYGLSNLNSSLWKLRRTGKSSGWLFIRLLCDADHLGNYVWTSRKKNRAVPAVCVIVALLVDLMNDQFKFLLYKERASQQICLGRFTVLNAVVDRWSTFGNSALLLCRSLRLRLSKKRSTELKFPQLIPPSLVNSDSLR